MENPNGIAAVARRRYEDRTIEEMIDPRLNEETYENIFTVNKGPDKDSLDAFIKIACQCVKETQGERPTLKFIITQLREALSFQEKSKDNLKFSLEGIKLATENFREENLIGGGAFWRTYKVALRHADRSYPIAVKRFDKSHEHEFLKELQFLLEYKHQNIVTLVGYCNDVVEKIIVYEYSSRGSLNKHLHYKDLTWMKRLAICIDIASGLAFLHEGGSRQETVIHRDIKGSNILLSDDWKAKISDFGLSYTIPTSKDIHFVIDNVYGTTGYCDPVYVELGYLTEQSDIYSFGVVLFEILCGKLMVEYINGRREILINLVKGHYEKGKLHEMVFEGIKDQIAPKSLTIFQNIAHDCLHHEREERPKSPEVLQQLKKALQFQEDYDIWKPKLPNDYKKLLQMSDVQDTNSTKKYEVLYKDLYHNFTKGILIEEGNVLFLLGGNGERNVTISANTFSYTNSCLHKWKSIPESRFHGVMEMLDIFNLKIKIETRSQHLSQNVDYGVYLVFKFSNLTKISSKPLYVNLTYQNKSKTSNAYFATWRDNDWMMIELWRFTNDKEDTILMFLLDGFSEYCCGDSTIYIEGIEFRAITNVKHEETDESKKVQQVSKSDSQLDSLQQSPTNHEEILKRSENYDDSKKLFWLGEVKGKKHLMLSAKEALNNYSNAELFKMKPSTHSRFPVVIELLPQQVFRINCTIKRQMLSRDVDYVCYLVFKLSKNCHGMHCPIKVRDLLRWTDKEAEIIYFISPSPWNLHDIDQTPKLWAEEWMAVKVWKFNINHEFKDDYFDVKLRLISYEGTMSGLIVYGLEFRPV
ncbi:hypothetical protein L2E82_28116 [Cichorium intybus]|uniref:Uncharacterized protein n=1 Tax=Cichorium intybus TaxID=13427 RepID=A0ACB9CUR1_CICIN|nr:hypothetical protein L2E82_28116 [Cichorium intybus]